ncbi:MAG: hypothetical protein H6Q28_282, partial [Bacteroidetes bacterium]|nr:hypothetical protein [Bacteroidota bacterium]
MDRPRHLFSIPVARVPIALAVATLFGPPELSASPADSVFTSSNLPIVVIDTHGQT